MSTTNIQFEFKSNFENLFSGIKKGMTDLSVGGVDLMKKLENAGQSAFRFNALQQFGSQLQSTFQGILAPGIALNTQMKETQAITGLSNKAMEELSNNARQMSKVFGVEAAGGMEAYKLILSQLGPSLAEHPHLLKMMGNQAAILSKQMGGDVPAAVEVLTSAMNAFGVDIKNPAEATRTMGNMMNIMSAAAKEGSAELPNIKNALGALGGTAKLAGVNFAETNAALQVLDKSSLKGSEGGTALRNVLIKMSEGTMMSKDSLRLLSAEGVDISKLADKTVPLVERLKMLNPMAADAGKLAQHRIGKIFRQKSVRLKTLPIHRHVNCTFVFSIQYFLNILV